jgi:hypothetical protein
MILTPTTVVLRFIEHAGVKVSLTYHPAIRTVHFLSTGIVEYFIVLVDRLTAFITQTWKFGPYPSGVIFVVRHVTL